MAKTANGTGNGKKKDGDASSSARSDDASPKSNFAVIAAVLIGVIALAAALPAVAAAGSAPQVSEIPPTAKETADVVAPECKSEDKEKQTADAQEHQKQQTDEVAAPAAPAVSDTTSLKWTPKTLSVVLPCAGEGLFAKKTVESVANSVPGGIGGSILADIIVVDDGSSPPLGKEFLTKEFRNKYPVTLVRHERAVGLMGAKSAGAAVATGDVIVFFDCHVAPQGKWYKEFLTTIAENYRRIVVPVITDLNIDTWKESSRGGGFAKCYLTFDADFKWINMEQPHMPALSGGLLGISRRWWNETEGYDSVMTGWGGENIDQSLRTWLCGGEIMSLPKAFVAHMWRKDEDKRTDRKYDVSAMDALKNKARAVLGWYDEFIEKAGQYQTLNWLGVGTKDPNIDKMMAMHSQEKPNLNTDMSNFNAVREKLGCKPFAWFLWRFRHIYVDGGLLPPQTFQLQEITSSFCLTFLGPMGVHPQGRAHVALLPCNNTGLPSHVHPDSQRFHMRNQHPKTGKCCSAIGSWNSDQCIVQLGDGLLTTIVCDVVGKQVGPWDFTGVGSESGTGQINFGGKCLVVDKKAQPLQIMKGVNSPKMKFAKCKKDTAPRWRLVAPQVPMETQLYEKTLRERPELFKEE